MLAKLKNLMYKLWKWERWDYRIKYIPLYPVWLWYCFRARSLWFFSTSNPTLTFGGFEGEGKKEMYDQLPPSTYPKSCYISGSMSFAEAEKAVAADNFTYPFAVKPNVGMMGYLFRKIDDINMFRQYHEKVRVDYIVQEFVEYPIEVSVFYWRMPDQAKGTITGFVKKEVPEVQGDGMTSFEQLMQQLIGRPGFKIEEWKAKHERKLHEVIPDGEKVRLSLVANLSRGGRLVSLKHHKDEKLLKVFDDLSHYTKHFYYGRYDIKCASIEDLKEGTNFSILEFNGSGAEPHHVYGAGNTLLQAHKIFLQHWKVLYKISKYNHDKGVPYWEFRKGLQFLQRAQKHFKNLKQLDTELEL
jgi:hypothetical protein